MAAYTKAICFYNIKSGQTREGKQSETIREHFNRHNIALEMINIPKPLAEINAKIDEALSQGADLVLAAGGDGTVALVCNPLIETDIPLGILPLGTGNLLAKQLYVPQKLEDALNLITGDQNRKIKIDTFQLADRHYLSNLSVGISSRIMQTTNSEEKQKLGVFAYLINFFQQILGLKLQKISLEIDHQQATHMASEVLITNIGIAGVEPLKWSEDISINDGELDLLVFRAKNILDFLRVLISTFNKNKNHNPAVRFFKVREYCRIDTQSPMQTQADGDPSGETPVEIRVKPGSLTVIAGEKNNQLNPLIIRRIHEKL